MITTESQGRLWSRVGDFTGYAAALLLLGLVVAGTGCSRPPDYINQPSIINIPESAMYPAATGDDNGANPYTQDAEHDFRGNNQKLNDQGGDLRIQKRGLNSEYVIYDPENPQADKYGIVYLQGDRSASKSEYTTYDPDHPEADERGMVHLTVRKTKDSKPGSSLEQQAGQNRSALSMRNSKQSSFQREVSVAQQHYVDSLQEYQRSNYEPPKKLTEASDYTNQGANLGKDMQVPQVSGVQAVAADKTERKDAKKEYPVGSMSVEEYSRVVAPRVAQIKNDSSRTVATMSAPVTKQPRPAQENMMGTMSVNSSVAVKQGPMISHVSITEIPQSVSAAAEAKPQTTAMPQIDMGKTNTNELTAPGIKIESSSRQNIPFTQNATKQSVKATSPVVKENLSISGTRVTEAGGVNTGGAYPGVKMTVQPTINKAQFIQPAVASRQIQPREQGISMEQTISDLERYVAAHPDQVKAQMALQLLHSVYGNKDAMRVLPAHMSSAQKSEMEELTQAILLAAQLSENNMSQQPEAANQALKALQEISGKLTEKADPVVTCMKICSKVEGFGQYEEIPAEALETGEPREVLVYCELENYQAERDAEGRFLTKLHASITLFNSSYRVVGQPLIADVNDKPTYHLRRDFFLRGPLTLPRLSAGQYEIVVTIEDKIAHKIAKAKRYRFEVKGAQ